MRIAGRRHGEDTLAGLKQVVQEADVASLIEHVDCWIFEARPIPHLSDSPTSGGETFGCASVHD
jgi:hypothetical protein